MLYNIHTTIHVRYASTPEVVFLAWSKVLDWDAEYYVLLRSTGSLSKMLLTPLYYYNSSLVHTWQWAKYILPQPVLDIQCGDYFRPLVALRQLHLHLRAT